MVSPQVFYRTVRDLKLVQIAGRISRHLPKAPPRKGPPLPVRERQGAWQPSVPRQPSLVGPATFFFLSETRELSACGWDSPATSRLWRYNLHYFDDLTAASADERQAWHQAIIRRWICENPVGEGTGWEPYPVSRRLVNWTKWILAGNTPSEDMLASLALQARWLATRMEWHLLGNHLLANAKALVFAGLLFTGAEADAWRQRGMQVLAREVDEQVLADGGHFELSPMYHAIVLEDLLDLFNVVRAYPNAWPATRQSWVEDLPSVIARMRSWLSTMCHPDGEISFFNDAATGVAPRPAAVHDYAARLGLGREIPPRHGVVHLAASGFIRVGIGECVAILDVGRVGPHHLPGHAHADTLSFEMSLRGRRVLVNSGTSLYVAGPERDRQRATESHNTVSVDDCNSSEVWSAFRVGGKAMPFALKIEHSPGRIEISCAHDGYRRLRPPATHARKWRFRPDHVAIVDTLDCSGRATSHWHWHPDLRLVSVTPSCPTNDSFSATLSAPGIDVSFRSAPVSGEAVTGSWHPAFGVSVAAPTFRCRLGGERSESEIRWS